jgi:hypothetical protein
LGVGRSVRVAVGDAVADGAGLGATDCAPLELLQAAPANSNAPHATLAPIRGAPPDRALGTGVASPYGGRVGAGYGSATRSEGNCVINRRLPAT